MDKLKRKAKTLRQIISDMGGMVIAFSGGADSALLLKVSKEALAPQRVLAAIASSPIFPAAETKWAKALAKDFGVRYAVLGTDEMKARRFRRNLEDHCYICKRGLFSKLSNLARQEGLSWVADGTNLDDISEDRSSFAALEELAIRHPLAEAKLTKSEVGALSRELSLPTWNRLPQPCLASRISLGVEITEERMHTIVRAESWLRRQGFERPIVRYHAEGLARLKLNSPDSVRCLEPAVRSKINRKFRELGFSMVALALEEIKI